MNFSKPFYESVVQEVTLGGVLGDNLLVLSPVVLLPRGRIIGNRVLTLVNSMMLMCESAGEDLCAVDNGGCDPRFQCTQANGTVVCGTNSCGRFIHCS